LNGRGIIIATRSTHVYEPTPWRAEWIIFFEKRVLFEWFRDRLKEQTHIEIIQQSESVKFKLDPLYLYRTLFFLYDPLTTSLHGLKKSIIHGAI